MAKTFLECGKIVSTQGLKGEIRVQPWCDSPEYLLQFQRLYLQEGKTEVKLEKGRTKGNLAILKLAGYDTVEQAETLRGNILFLNRDDAPDDGAYFIQDLLGLNVLDADSGESYGTLTDVFPTGANDVYEVTGADNKKRLLPAIPQVVVQVDITGGKMIIRPLEGLFDDAD